MSRKKETGKKKKVKAMPEEIIESESAELKEEMAEVYGKKRKGKRERAQDSEYDEDFGEDREEAVEEEEDQRLKQDFLQETFARAPKKVYKGTLVESKVYVWNKQEAEEVYDLGCFGKVIEDKNELSLEEALLLMKRNKLKASKDDKELTAEEFYNHACSLDKEFPWKYTVYEELRARGLLVRTGFKFGTHFRVYARGVKLKRGPKSVKEHTKWIVHAIPENFTCSFPELSRAVRLAHNIRAKMLWAVVDEEGDVTYYEVLRKTP